MMQAAMQAADEQTRDIERRCGYIWAYAMLAAGLSARTVNRVARTVPEVKHLFGTYREDRLADFAFVSKLREKGVKASMTETEL